MSMPVSPPSLGPDLARTIYRKAYLINRTDERFRAMLTNGELAVAYYPVRGQEVIAAAAMAALRQDDYLVTTYRGLHDALAKGIPSRLLWAEFAGKRTGTCKGKGGPMHITHPETGVMVTTGIVGSGLPIANGLAMASQIRGESRVAVASFGDGASNIGAFHEALNMASVWKLPVIFLCQNNQYAEHTALAAGTSVSRISDRAVAYGMPGIFCDGLDPASVYEAMNEAVGRARAGGGPTLLEAGAFRLLGHIFGADYSYVSRQDLHAAEERASMAKLRQWMIERQVRESDLERIEKEVDAEINDAVAFALDSEPPDPDDIRFDIYATEQAA
ncbi:thiamine pyrophosphate-dependent dehydrogenase E1 component subunit alpha [Sphingomonas sp. ID1715]|uniref:thiamine pyrophosphate-dependent dehydrogenase E1 component subunit alpha n=1 Tax=Sphingomonas sp. ID1715 TaxID=1656898 RepID=UPI0020C52ACD|nr:thiamine pyrophosphate-dependent dehydrogenase E1 component subunit alpha [Sphingomonas sp. ID1715]